MITDQSRSVIISSKGWVDHDSLWLFETATAEVRNIPLRSGAKYASLHTRAGEYFAVGHHFDGERFEISVRPFSKPGEPVANVTVDSASNKLVGDLAAWKSVPNVYVCYLKLLAFQDFVLVHVDPYRGEANVRQFGWYDDAYDKGYQGITAALELPEENLALVSIQRCSDLVLHALDSGKMVRKVSLAGRFGNGFTAYRRKGNEIWASDYDHIVTLDRSTFEVKHRKQLQDGNQFIGDFAFSDDESSCVIARPFSGDVICVSPNKLDIIAVAKLGKQPLEAILLSGDRVVARDWKSGDLLEGDLE
jgi:hypothetical protein